MRGMEKHYSVPIDSEDEEELCSLEGIDFETESVKIQSEMEEGRIPVDISLPKQHPLWLSIGLSIALFKAAIKNKEIENSGSINEESFAKLETKISELLKNHPGNEPVEVKRNIFEQIVPSGLLLVCILMFGFMAFRPVTQNIGLSPEEIKAAMFLKGSLSELAYCKGDNFEIINGLCTVKPQLKNGVLEIPGWKFLEKNK